MMKRAAVLLLAATAGAFAADPNLMRFVDPNAKVIAGVHVDRSVASQFGQFILSQAQDDQAGIAQFIDLTGFDPRRDLREVIAGSTAGEKGTGIVIASGSFNIPKLKAAALAHGGSVTSYSGVPVITKHGDNGWVALVDDQTAIAGPAPQVKAALDQRANPGMLDPKLSAKVQEVSGKYDAWMVSMVPMSQIAEHMPTNGNNPVNGDLVRGIDMTDAGVTFGSNVQVFAEAVARSDKDAQSLLDVAKFLTGMVQMNSNNPDAAKIATLLKNLQIGSNGNVVSMTLSIPETDLENMIQQGKAHGTKATVQPKRITYRH